MIFIYNLFHYRKKENRKKEKRIERVAGIEPASLAWKARGYSRRRFIIFNASNSKPNMKLWFHSAPLWKIDIF